MFGGAVAYTLIDSNVLAVRTWLQFANEMNGMLKLGSNRITDGWRDVGLGDGDILNSRSWKQAIETMGQMAGLRKEAGTGGHPPEGQPEGQKASSSSPLGDLEDHAARSERLMAEATREQRRQVVHASTGTTLKLQEMHQAEVRHSRAAASPEGGASPAAGRGGSNVGSPGAASPEAVTWSLPLVSTRMSAAAPGKTKHIVTTATHNGSIAVAGAQVSSTPSVSRVVFLSHTSRCGGRGRGGARSAARRGVRRVSEWAKALGFEVISPAS